MDTDVNLIACLGNPGKKYFRNRHNVGFMAGEYLSKEYSISLNKTKNNALYGSGVINGKNVIILLPQTFMNLSGDAVIPIMKSNGIRFENLIVIHDELELPFGEIRLKTGGGHKGHNGLRSIMQVGGSPDFKRIRFGIGRPDPDIGVADYVLSDFTSAECSKMDALMETVAQIIIPELL